MQNEYAMQFLFQNQNGMMLLISLVHKSSAYPEIEMLVSLDIILKHEWSYLGEGTVLGRPQ